MMESNGPSRGFFEPPRVPVYAVMTPLTVRRSSFRMRLSVGWIHPVQVQVQDVPKKAEDTEHHRAMGSHIRG